MRRRQQPDPETVFRADVPPAALTDETDAFGHRDYAAAIASAVAEAEPPFTLGLFGQWGVGKTTILEETARRLPKECAFAIFDAWRYEHDALRRQFLSEVSRQLTEAKQLHGYDREKALEELVTPISSVRPAGLTFRRESALRATVVAGLTAVLVFLGLKFGLSVAKSAIGSAISAVVTLAVLVITPLGQIFDVKYETVTRPRIEDPERFTEKFEDLLAHLKQERLVVAIDNLDRCAPARVEEVFDTLNTYLEPAGAVGRSQGLSSLLTRKRKAGQKKEAVFIVAADVDALRRHLEARERQASGGKADDARRYTEEYLRKIFKASIPIKPLLDQDMRAYVQKEMNRFLAVHSLEPVDRTRLVELVSAALKRNPRRVRQFVNNLELRLQLLEARETVSKAVAAALSENVLMVAKLTLLEEEWPESYNKVVDDPRILDDWHAKQTTGDLSTVPEVDRVDPAFSAFLNASRAIRSPHLAAFLSLKQSREELLLPRYDDFRAALLAGDAAALSDVLKDADEQTSARYAEQLMGIFREEISHGYVDSARTIVERATAEPKLNQHAPKIDALLTEASRNPNVRPELRQSDPRPILGSAQRLPADDFALLLEPFVDLVSFKAEGSERFGQVIDALTTITERLPSQARQTIRDSIASDEISTSFGEYLPLVEHDPELLPNQAGAKALDAFVEDFDVDSAAFSVLETSFKRGAPADQQNRFVSAVVRHLVSVTDAGGMTEDNQRDAERMVRLANQLTDISEASVESLIAELLTPVATNKAGPLVAPILDLAGALASTRPDGGALVAPAMDALADTRPDDLIAYSSERGEALAPALKGQALPRLSKLAQSLAPFERKERAADAILRINLNDDGGYLSAAVSECVGRDDFESFEAFIAKYRNELASGVPKLLTEVLNRAGDLGPGANAAALLAALTLSSAMSDEEKDRLRALVRDGLVHLGTSGSIEQMQPVLERFDAIDSLRDTYALLIKEVWDIEKGQADPHQVLLAFVVANFTHLDPDRRAAFLTQFGNWVTQSPSLRQPLSNLATQIEDLKPTERQQLVDRIIEAETLESEPNAREPLLRSARAIANFPRATGAKKRLQERLDALERGSDTDRVVWRRLTEG